MLMINMLKKLSKNREINLIVSAVGIKSNSPI